MARAESSSPGSPIPSGSPSWSSGENLEGAVARAIGVTVDPEAFAQGLPRSRPTMGFFSWEQENSTTVGHREPVRIGAGC